MTIRQSTWTAAVADRPSTRARHERFLEMFVRIEPGEGRCLLLFFGYAFLVLVSWYIVRTLREPLLLVDASAEVKTYASATAALVLLFLVPLYGAAFRRTERNQLVRWVTAFFIATLGALCLAARSGLDIGFIYYAWVGVLGVTIIAQFWAHATDCFSVGTGQRLFPAIMAGATLGGIVGPSIYRALHDVLDASQLMLVAMGLLALTVPLVEWSRSSVPPSRRGSAGGAVERGTERLFGGFSLIARDRYLLLVASLVVLLNCVNTMGEFLLSDLVLREAELRIASDPSLDKGQLIGEFYSSLYLAINVLTVVMQVLLVGRLFRWIGVNGALVVLPLVALIGYGLFAFLPIFALLRAVKVCEGAGNYSILNTARQALFLPLSTTGKYEGKIATDTFFWRVGDLVPAAIVFVGLNWLDLDAQQFAIVNMALSLMWLAVAVQLARRNPERAPPETRAPRRRLATLALAGRVSSSLAAVIGLVALTSAAPADAAADSAAAASSTRLFDEQQPLDIELAADWRALCRNPQREVCDDLPATLGYQDSLGRLQSVAVTLRTRGRYRADTVQCGLPALFVFFTGETRETLFEGEHMLPLTTHCDGAPEYEQYLLKEYLAYRFYETLTSKSLHVRLARVTYRDTSGRSKSFERYAFFTEHFESFAGRIGVSVRPKQVFDPRTADPAEIAMFDIFQYAIGNTDWSVVKQHNVLLIEREDGTVTPVPFDFDFSGLVNARYASVSPQLAIRSVRQRVFRGICRPDTDWKAAFAHFTDRRDAVLALADELPALSPRQRADVSDYLDEAFRTFASPEHRQAQIVDACRRGEVR